MANSIERVTKYLDTYQEILMLTGLTSDMNANKEIKFTGAKTVKVLKVDTGYASNYNRAVGYVKNDVNASWQEETMDQDRQHAFGIDSIDVEELGLDAVNKACFDDAQKKDLAELDFYRLGKIASTSGVTKPSSATLSNGQAVANAIALAEASQVDNEGDLRDCVLYITPTLYTQLKQYLGLNCGRFGSMKDINMDFDTLDGIKVVQVPQARMYVGTQYNASTGKIEAKVTDSKTQKINFMLVNKNSVCAPVKVWNKKFIPSNQNPTSDEDLTEIRFYHTAFVFDLMKTNVYVHTQASA